MVNLASSAYADDFERGEPGPSPGLRPTLEGITDRLEHDAEDRVGRRRQVEQRWLDDLRQLHGQYDKDTLDDLSKAKKSKLFINQTRSKTGTCESKLSDMLFPTDEENWGIEPTPVPEMEDAAGRAGEQAEELVAQATETSMGGDQEGAARMAIGAQKSANQAAQIKAVLDDAKARAKAMQKEMRDQLIECGYSAEARKVIHDACGPGTGIMKGPVGNKDRSRRSWTKRKQQEAEEAQAPERDIYDLSFVEDSRPAYYRADFWGFFPETDSLTMEDNGSTFERHLLSDKGLRDLSKQPGFIKDGFRQLMLTGKPRKALPFYVADLRAITNDNPAPTDARWIVWEYRGPLEYTEMEELCRCLEREDLMEASMVDGQIDPLKAIDVVLWFCDGQILKFGINHLDSGESLYSLFSLVKDDTSVWGIGIPYLMRDPQKALNGAWRMMMDNAGLSSGPQIVVDQAVVEPVDGEWGLMARKLWLRLPTAPAGRPGIETYDIPSHQPELQAIVEMAMKFMDDVTNISVLASGEQGAHTTQTSSGMALLMNAVNVIFRGFVRNFDDDLTVPVMLRLYDWNMQFSQKDAIKGDMEVKAKGSSVLLVREVQAQNLMVLANMTSHPILGILLKAAPLLRLLAQSLMVPADDIVLTDDEIKTRAEEEAARAQEQPEDTSIAVANIKAKTEFEKVQKDLQIAQLERDTAMMTLAETRNMKLEDIQAMLEGKELDAAAKERLMVTELAAETRLTVAGATGGSGGNLSAGAPQ